MSRISRGNLEYELDRASNADLMQASALIAESMLENPFNEWLFPEVASRRDRTSSYYNLLLRHHYIPNGICEIIRHQSRVVGISVWHLPAKWKIPESTSSAILEEVRDLFDSNLFEVGRGIREIESKHPQFPHLYAGLTVVAPEMQGTGLGSILYGTLLTYADEHNLPIYLELTRERDQSWIKGLGFEVTGEIDIADGPTLWTCLRLPTPS
ncbi:GNAT family N-acetyltransferase [Streptomyces chartreusis]|uniref:GNAT family N-acetyltransferase n=1 Tax=Streptomyces chartreusis TaxID=1969 RepID=UPI0036769A55